MESQQQFCLKWNSFGSNLATAFGNLFKSESLTDVILFCEGVTFKAHRLILAACSKHFQDLFERAPLCPSVLVILDGTSSANMSALLEFMYKGEVHVSQESLSSFLKAAECLQVKGLSVEHEKLAVVQGTVGHDAQLDSPTGRKQAKISSVKKEAPEGPEPLMHPSTSSGPGYGPVISPYMHPPHYRPAYEQRMPASAALYDAGPRKRHHRGLAEAVPDASMRASVLRDGSKARPPSEPELAYRPLHPETEPAPEGRYEGPDPAYDRTAAVDSESSAKASLEGRHSSAPPDQGNSCPEDLRVNMELSTRPDEMHASIAAPYSEKSPETAPEIIQTNTWNCGGSSVKMSPLKGGGVQTQDGRFGPP
ncbi:broad-complex core protein isoforms 1/2/3/4/5 isoform X2 [Bacillus rossius redtenbacheri]|uniref:broad-complex core protein isoforms 1/2/3/4/5 isoform X2 n=1 Tax=Bacillus rossius redtenbacheri TaxID=93214 RepID=UPI002FDD1E21